MSKAIIDELLSTLNTDEIKNAILSLIEQFFPIMAESERQNFVITLLGKSGDDNLSSMVNR